MNINTVKDLKTAVRNGPYTWPGGYPVYFIASDGEALSYDAVKDNFRIIAESIRDHMDDGWRVVAADINYENPDLYCAHTNKHIECAYCE